MRSSTRGRITAVLGPTNTGKTHLALARLMGHPSGVVGFPLRLLARENYDKMARTAAEATIPPCRLARSSLPERVPYQPNSL